MIIVIIYGGYGYGDGVYGGYGYGYGGYDLHYLG